MTLWQLFVSFFKIGSFTIGGGYAMIPLMEWELVDRRQWIDREEFLDVLSVAQALPGVFAVNMATAIGFRFRGFRGAVAAIIGTTLVPIAVILLLAMCLTQFRDNPGVERFLRGVRPAVVALIAAPVFRLAKTAGLSWNNVWIPLLAVVLIVVFGLSPIWVVVATIVLGACVGMIRMKRKEAHR